MKETLSSPFKQEAKKLYQSGYSIIPIIQNDKRAFVKDWSKYCTEMMPQKEIKSYTKEPYLNIGVALGPASNVVALDFDDDINGFHDLIKEALPESPVIKIGKKGFTAFYKYNGEINKSWKFKQEGKKYTVVELLSKGRQTVMPPSNHPSGGAYYYESIDELSDVSPDDLPTLPEDCIELIDTILGVTHQKESKRLVASSESIVEALEFLDYDDYDDWVQAGMAIKSQYPDEEGFNIWDEWSRQSAKYSPKDADEKWRSFKGTGISIGTLFYRAMQEGYECSFSDEELKQDVLQYFVTLDQVEDDLDTWSEDGRYVGTNAGIPGLDKKLHFRKGEVTVFSGYGNAGKSEFLDSVVVGLMQSQDDWHFAVCSMEKSINKHFDDLVHKVSKTPRKNRSAAEYRDAKSFLRNRTVMIDYNSVGRDFDAILMQCKRYMRVGKIDGIVIDPFNYLMSRYKFSSPLAHVNHVITACADFAKTNNVHIFMVAHPTKPDRTFGELPQMTKYSISGGADWVNVADNIVIVSRKEDNTTHILVDKIRDQEVDSLGHFRLKYNKVSRGYQPLINDEFLDGDDF